MIDSGGSSDRCQRFPESPEQVNLTASTQDLFQANQIRKKVRGGAPEQGGQLRRNLALNSPFFFVRPRLN